MQTRVPTVVIAFGAILLATCGDPDAAADTPSFTTVVDTLGDTIVVRITGDIAAVNELKLSEVWRVGDPDGDETTGFGFVHTLGVNSASDSAASSLRRERSAHSGDRRQGQRPG